MSRHRYKKVCQVCGKPFYGGDEYYYCPECARTKKLDTVVRIRTCIDCDVEFYGGPRARRCPDCAYKARQECNRAHKATGAVRSIGSTDICAICGKEYTVTSGRQKYCSSACQRIGVLAWQREHKRQYNKASGQDIKKQERREGKKKICIYCQRPFKSKTASGFCSDYCRKEQTKITQCNADIKRGYKRDIDKYLTKRNKYREQVSEQVGTDIF